MLLEETVLKTLSFIPIPLTPGELYEFLITREINSSVTKKGFEQALERLLHSGKVFKSKGYVTLSPRAIPIQIQYRKEQIKLARIRFRKVKKLFNPLKVFGIIRFIGVFVPVCGKSSAKGGGLEVLIVTKDGALNSSKLVLRLYLNIKRKQSLLPHVTFVDIQNLKLPHQSLQTAYRILMTRPILNKDETYEKFVYKNKWVFDYFANYPLEKVSLNYRIVK